jgi:hypothetical protein
VIESGVANENTGCTMQCHCGCRKDWILQQKSLLPIDERPNPCYNGSIYARKEGSNMGEQVKKRQISAGLLAHVDAGRRAPLSEMVQ